MPCFRGIEVFIGAESELERLPEFPHPDSASVSLVIRDQPTSPPRGSPSSSVHSAGDASQTRISKANPRVSVYIPSLPGIRFWIQYSVTHPPVPPCHLYFKLFANGKSITSWGIDPAKTATGTVARGLYAPDETWHHQDDSGEFFKQEGIESRLFYFPGGPGSDSSTDDGGVIEVQVYRAKGRRRCAPRLEQCRDQEDNDILSPSGGLLECPEDAAFYTWLLLDPKDSPYATFRYYYRSWARLRYLNVSPPPRPTGPAGLFPSEPLKGAPGLPASGKGPAQPDPGAGPSTPECAHDDPPDESKSQAGPSPDEARGRSTRVPFPLTNPPELWHARSTRPHIPQPSKHTRDGFSDRDPPRPLPALPSRPPRAKRASPDAPAGAGAGAPANASAQGGEGGGSVKSGDVTGPVFSPGGDASAPRPLSPSPKIPRTNQGDSTRVPSPEVGSLRLCPSPEPPTSPKGTAGQQQQPEDGPAPQLCPSPPTHTRSPLSKISTLSEAEWMAPRESPASEPSSSEKGPEDLLRGQQHGAGGLGQGGGIPALPRGLLGPALTEIPLRGPTGDLMRRLRSEDPFKDG